MPHTRAIPASGDEISQSETSTPSQSHLDEDPLGSPNSSDVGGKGGAEGDVEKSIRVGASAERSSLPVVVVAGRPNVGKSTLVNRIVGRRAAVVEELPGVTRDRLELEADWNGLEFTVVDTGGWLGGGDALDEKVASQALRAMKAADLVLVVVDTTVGATDDDERFARLVKRSGVPAILVANKVDNERRENEAWELLSLGLGDPRTVSALHGRGTGELLDEVAARLSGSRPAGGTTTSPDDHEPDPESGKMNSTSPSGATSATSATRVAIVGRPNVGKSTLFNRLVGEERSIVHDVPGTTRDAVDTLLDTPDGPVRFVDTAGMRRRYKSAEGTEYFAMVRSLRAIDEADVVLLVIDATEGVTHQDQRLAERIGNSGSPIVVVLNKWELVDPEARQKVVYDVEDRLAFLGEAPLVKISALTGMGVHKILRGLGKVVDAYHRRVPTAELNRVITAIQAAHAAPGSRIKYAVQGAVDPPTFTLFATRRIPPTYLRYVEKRLREDLGMGATPLKLRVRVGV
jgi:GTP-binding protein